MRIVVIGRLGIEAFGLHIADTFRELGHEVAQCNPFEDVRLGWYDLPMMPSIVKKVRGVAVKEMFARESYAVGLVSKVRSLLADGDCDLILATHDFLSPIALQRLRSEFSAKIVLWFPDHAARLERAFMLCGLYDLMFFKDPFLVDRFRSELGLNQAHYLPECCRSDLHALGPDPGVAETRDLGTAGNIHPSRAAVLKRLINEGHRVTVWGPPVARWMQDVSSQIETLPFVANHEKVRAFRSCKIILNTTHPAEVEGTNVRTFEAAATGAFQLVNHRSALESLFEVGKEITTFESLDDLVDKVRYFLPRDAERREIADRAQARALAEHTYQHRINSILSMLEQANGNGDS